MRLLFVSHCPSANTRAIRDAALAGIDSLTLDKLEVCAKAPPECTVDDVVNASGILVGTTENFAAMAGLTKDFFERIYYPCLEQTQGLPAALYVRAGEDGEGTRLGIEKILTGLRWRLIASALILRGDYQEAFTDQAAELAMTLAAGLDAGLF